MITGTGKGFSAGMDLKGFASGEFPVAGDRGFAGIAQRSARKPLIAAIEGFALAGGLEIALSCDIIVASREAKLGIPEVGVGLFAGAGALLRLPRRVGLGQAALLALTGKPISGEEGHRIGLVDRLTDAGGAVAEALTLAETIAANAPAGAGRLQGRPRRRVDQARRRVLAVAAAVLPGGLHLQGRHRRGDGLRREAQAELAGA